MHAYADNSMPDNSNHRVQPGLSAIYRSINDTIINDYLGWPLTCFPLIFTADISNKAICIDTLKYNWESDTVCSCNSYFRSGGYFGRMWTSADAVSINEEECEFVIKRDSSRLTIKTYDYLILKWDIPKLERCYIIPDSVLVCDGFFSYYSRAIIRNGKIVDYRTLPNVELDDCFKQQSFSIKLPFQSDK